MKAEELLKLHIGTLVMQVAALQAEVERLTSQLPKPVENPGE